MNLWSTIIALVAMAFSIGCFCLFVINGIQKPVPEKVVEDAARRAEARSLSPAALGGLVKALADAFSKVGPAALALIGAILFLLLAGEASDVFHLTDPPTKPASSSSDGKNTGNPDPARNAQ